MGHVHGAHQGPVPGDESALPRDKVPPHRRPTGQELLPPPRHGALQANGDRCAFLHAQLLPQAGLSVLVSRKRPVERSLDCFVLQQLCQELLQAPLPAIFLLVSDSRLFRGESKYIAPQLAAEQKSRSHSRAARWYQRARETQSTPKK